MTLTPISSLRFKAAPLPRWLVLGNSVAVIGISTILAGAMIGLIVIDWNLLSTILGYVLLELSLVVGILQYVAEVRLNYTAAAIVAKLHLFGSAVSGFLFLTLLFSGLIFGIIDFRLLLPLFAISIYCGFCWRTSLNLKEILCSETADSGLRSPKSEGRFQFTLKELLGLVMIVSIIAAVAVYTIRDAGKKYEEHVSTDEAPVDLLQLPEGATDVCYYWDGLERRLIYEFSVDEAEYIDWVRSKRRGYGLAEIPKGKQFQIMRYTMLKSQSIGKPPGNGDVATITQGYFGKYSPIGKQGFTLAYDSAKRRAYYCDSVFPPQP